MNIPFSPPYIDEDIRREVIDILNSGWITSGARVQQFEKLIGSTAGIDNVVCCNSATSGLLLALHWFGVGKGDEVIIPSYTYAATALVVMHVGATPVMVDVGTDFNVAPEELEAKISEKTKVIIPVDIAGWPCDYCAINAIVSSSKRLFTPTSNNQRRLGRILILSDSAHSIGAIYRNKPSARNADLAVFSFHAVKNITTAEGGAICINLPSPFNNENVYKELKLWTLNGQTKDALAKTNGAGWQYDIVYPGFKMNMPDICAAIGLAQLRKYQSVLLPERNRVFKSYLELFSGCDWAELPPWQSEERTSACHIFALRIRGIREDQRNRIIDRLTDSGVSTNVHFQPLPLLTIFKERGYSIEEFPVAYDNYSREISLPVYPELDEAKILYVVNSLTEAYEAVMSLV